MSTDTRNPMPPPPPLLPPGDDREVIPAPLLKEAEDLRDTIRRTRRDIEAAASVIVSRALELGEAAARLRLKYPRAAVSLIEKAIDAARLAAGGSVRPEKGIEDEDPIAIRDLFEQWMIEQFRTAEVRVFVSSKAAVERAELSGLLDPLCQTRKDLSQWIREVVAGGRIIELRESARSGCRGYEWCHPDHQTDEVRLLAHDPHLKTAIEREQGSFPGANGQKNPAPKEQNQ